MRNFIKILTIVFFAGTIFSSCTKEDVTTAAGNEQLSSADGTVKNHNTLSASKAWGKYWMWSNEYIKCSPLALDCYDPIVIKPAQSVLDAFKTAVQGGCSSAAYFFNNEDWAALFPGLAETDDLVKLQSGNYDMIRYADGVMNYYACGSTLPLTFYNEEFVLVIDKTTW